MKATEKQHDAIRIELDIAAPPQKVFDALTIEAQLLEWWGDDQFYRCESWTVDLRVGGRYRSAGVNADGRPFSVEGEYLEIDPPRRLSYTWSPSWDEMRRPTTVTFDLEATETGTRLTMTHSGFAGYPKALGEHREGWPHVLGWLKTFAEASEG